MGSALNCLSIRVCVLAVVLLMVEEMDGKAITRVIDGFNTTATQTEFQPILSADRLHEIRLYDRMKCFPKVLCTLTKSDAFNKLGSVDLNDLADGYLRLLTAFPGGPPSDLVTRDDSDFKHDFGNQFPYSEYAEENDNEDEKTTRDENESEELLLTDPLLHQKEKLEMKKLMDELISEEKAEANKQPQTWTQTAIKIPFKLGTSLLNNVVIPYLAGDRRKRDIHLSEVTDRKRSGKAIEVQNNKNPIASAMTLWNRLSDAKQCDKLYPTCPFEAWEVVSMIKLIKDSQMLRTSSS